MIQGTESDEADLGKILGHEKEQNDDLGGFEIDADPEDSWTADRRRVMSDDESIDEEQPTTMSRLMSRSTKSNEGLSNPYSWYFR
jgi:hypothetical protein